MLRLSVLSAPEGLKCAGIGRELKQAVSVSASSPAVIVDATTPFNGFLGRMVSFLQNDAKMLRVSSVCQWCKQQASAVTALPVAVLAYIEAASSCVRNVLISSTIAMHAGWHQPFQERKSGLSQYLLCR